MKIPKFSKDEWVIGFLAVAAYLVCVINDFHTDDWIVLSFLRDGFSFSDFVSMENAGRFRPLTNIFIYVRYLIFGDTPSLYYALNIGLHALVSVAFYKLLKKLDLPGKSAFFAALFFAIYFQHYEAVIWLYGIIREFAALAYIISFWYLRDYIRFKDRASFTIFMIASIFGLFIVEDFVVAPIIFALFAWLLSRRSDRISRLKPVIISGFAGLVIYFSLRTLAISRPGITEEYYYLGFHMIRVLFEYMGWFVIPSPAHQYFQSLASSLPSILYYIWRGVSYIAIFGFLPFSIWLYLKSPRQVRFFILFVFVTMLPIIPLNYKVSSRNIYLPSMGLAVMAGYLLDRAFLWTRSSARKKTVFAVLLTAFIVTNIGAIAVASLEYNKTQRLVRNIVDDIRNSGIRVNDYNCILMDDVPGRAIIGPSMIYRLHYTGSLIASNDPVNGPIDIAAAADSVALAGDRFMVFDYRNGHMVADTDDYIKPQN